MYHNWKANNIKNNLKMNESTFFVYFNNKLISILYLCWTVKNTCKDHKCNYMCVLGSNNSICICQDGYSKDSKGICIQELNRGIKFDSSIINQRGENTHEQNGVFIGIIIVLIACIILLSGYFYYQKFKPGLLNKNNLR